jgi:predicted N-acyltransferase
VTPPESGAPGISISQVVTLAAIPVREWDFLAASAQLYQTREWLRWAEEYYQVPTRYVLARDAGGNLIGAVVTYLARDVPDRPLTWYDPVRMFLAPYCDTTSFWQHWHPVLLVGGCSGYHSEMLLSLALDGNSRFAVARSLLAECRAIAAAEGAGSLAFMYAPKQTCEEISKSLDVSAQMVLTSADAIIPLSIGTDGLNGYLARFPSARRSKLRKEVELFTAAGGRVAEYRLGEVLDQVAPLLGAHQRKYGSPVTDDEMARYLALQEKYLDSISVVFVDKRQDGRINGFALCYSHNDTLYCRAAGFEPKCAAPFAYFNLAIYAPVRHAAAHGLTAVELGLGSYQGKRLRGAELAPLWSVVVPPERADPAWEEVLGRPSPQAVEAGCT